MVPTQVTKQYSKLPILGIPCRSERKKLLCLKIRGSKESTALPTSDTRPNFFAHLALRGNRTIVILGVIFIGCTVEGLVTNNRPSTKGTEQSNIEFQQDFPQLEPLHGDGRFNNVRKEEPWLPHGIHTVYHTAKHGCLRVLCWRKTCCITVTACFYSSLARISLLCATLPDDMHYAILNTSFRTDCTVW